MIPLFLVDNVFRNGKDLKRFDLLMKGGLAIVFQASSEQGLPRYRQAISCSVRLEFESLLGLPLLCPAWFVSVLFFFCFSNFLSPFSRM